MFSFIFPHVFLVCRLSPPLVAHHRTHLLALRRDLRRASPCFAPTNFVTIFDAIFTMDPPASPSFPPSLILFLAFHHMLYHHLLRGFFLWFASLCDTPTCLRQRNYNCFALPLAFLCHSFFNILAHNLRLFIALHRALHHSSPLFVTLRNSSPLFVGLRCTLRRSCCRTSSPLRPNGPTTTTTMT